MIDFEKYKCKISLPDFLKDVFGFRKDEGSSQNYPKLKNPETGEVFVIKRNHKGHYTYFDIHNDNIKGKTILDYVQKRLSIDQFGAEGKLVSLPEVAKYLDNYITNGKFVSPENSNFVLNNESLSRDYITKALLDLKPFTDHTFLLNRGLSVDTFENSLFNGVIFNKDYYDKETQTNHVNTVFKMWSQDGVIAISQRNESFKGCLGTKSESVCTSNFDNNRQIETFYIGESFIDCLSHFQLNKEKLEQKNIVYMSSEGNLVEGQIAVIQKAISNKCPINVISIFDNDLAGHYYSAKLFGKINLVEQKDEINQAPNQSSELSINVFKGESTSHLEIFILKDKDSPYSHQNFIDSVFKEKNEKLSDLFGEAPFNIKHLFENGKLIKLDVAFENSFEAWSAAAEAVKELKFGNANSVAREIPLLSDFNDDLRAIAGKHEQYKIKNGNNRLEIFYKDKFIGHVPKEYLLKYNLNNNSEVNRSDGLNL